MGFRFRRQLKIFPGVRLNMSKNHLISSVTVGSPKSLLKSNVPVGRSGPATSTVGNLGGLLTGLSYTHQWKGTERKPSAPVSPSELSDKSVLFAGFALIALLAAVAGGRINPRTAPTPAVAEAPAPVAVLTPDESVIKQCRDIVLRPGFTADPSTVVFAQPAVARNGSGQFAVSQSYTETSFGATRSINFTCTGEGDTVTSHQGQLAN